MTYRSLINNRSIKDPVRMDLSTCCRAKLRNFIHFWNNAISEILLTCYQYCALHFLLCWRNGIKRGTLLNSCHLQRMNSFHTLNFRLQHRRRHFHVHSRLIWSSKNALDCLRTVPGQGTGTRASERKTSKRTSRPRKRLSLFNIFTHTPPTSALISPIH